MGTHGIFCLEGEWDERLDQRLSVRPGLDMLMSVREDGLIHRNASTRDEFRYYFTQWASTQYSAFPVAYLAYHGTTGSLELSPGQDLRLSELAEYVEPGALKGRTIYFGSCRTMAGEADSLRAFAEATGVKALVGYTRNVKWAQSVAFDFTLLPELLDSTNMQALDARLRSRHKYFVEELGLRIATKTWVSP